MCTPMTGGAVGWGVQSHQDRNRQTPLQTVGTKDASDIEMNKDNLKTDTKQTSRAPTR